MFRFSIVWHKLLKLLIQRTLILGPDRLIQAIHSLYELFFQKKKVQPCFLSQRCQNKACGGYYGERTCFAAAEEGWQRRAKGSVIRVVRDAFPHHSQAEQHRREEGEQTGGDKNADHNETSMSAYAFC